MDKKLVEQATGYMNNGGELFFRRSHTGLSRIKIKYGPFKIFTKRFETDMETFEAIKAQYRKH